MLCCVVLCCVVLCCVVKIIFFFVFVSSRFGIIRLYLFYCAVTIDFFDILEKSFFPNVFIFKNFPVIKNRSFFQLLPKSLQDCFSLHRYCFLYSSPSIMAMPSVIVTISVSGSSSSFSQNSFLVRENVFLFSFKIS